MENVDLDLDDGSSPAKVKQANPQEARKQSIQRCIQSLVHVCQCHDANCRLSRCQRMKRVVMHTKVCKRKTNAGCLICKQLIALCCYHAKHCLEAKCPVPFCSNIKYKMKQQQLQQRLQQIRLMRRRGAVRAGIAGAPSAGFGLHRQALQQLMHALRSPQSPEQQQQILAILKANPQLMAAFIRQRQAQEAVQGGATGVVGA